MAPSTELMEITTTTTMDRNGDIQPMGLDKKREVNNNKQSMIAPVPRTKPIIVPSPSWPRQQLSDSEHSPSSFELLQQHVNHIAQQGNDKEGNILSPLMDRLSYATDSSDEEEEDEKKVKCTASKSHEDTLLKGILVHHHERGQSVPPDRTSRGTPFFDATEATIVVQPPPRPQTVHFSNDPPQVFHYPPSQQRHYVEPTNPKLLLSWPQEENEEYIKKQKEKERLIQEKLKRINEKWK